MPSSAAGPSEELADRQARRVAPRLVLPDGPHYPRLVQAWLWLKRPTWFLDHCSRAYGDVFTMRLPLGMDLVHVTDPELVKAVFGGSSDVLRAGQANAAILGPLLGPHSVLVLDGPEHLRQRKLILPAFHGDRMRAWEATIRDITRAEIARWPTGKSFALRPGMQSITLDVIMRVVFGVYESARQDGLRRRIATVTSIGRDPLLLLATRDRRLGPHAPWARFIRARDALHEALADQIRQRRHAPDLEQRSDVLSELLLARDDEGQAMTDDEVCDELVTLLFAGHETTATSLAWAFDLLLHHPRVLSRLMAELDGGESEYLDATIMETLRVRPVIALVDRHVRQATRIGGHTIPAGTVVCPNIYLTQRREDLYQDPAAFRPERFAGQSLTGFGWFPFGGGIRRCLGATFATFEMRIVIPEVLHAVALRPASRRPARIRRESVTFVPHDGARCIVTARIQPAARRSLRPDLSTPRPDLLPSRSLMLLASSSSRRIEWTTEQPDARSAAYLPILRQRTTAARGAPSGRHCSPAARSAAASTVSHFCLGANRRIRA
jgi:cytochrome P450 family 135